MYRASGPGLNARPARESAADEFSCEMCSDAYRFEVEWMIYVEPGIIPTCSYTVTWEGALQDLGGTAELYTTDVEYDGRTWDVYYCRGEHGGWWPYQTLDDFWFEIGLDASSPRAVSEFRLCALHDG